MATTNTAVTVRISDSVIRILGLDDSGRYADIERGGGRGRWIELTGSAEALTDLATELRDRATEGDDGFNESPRDKATARRAVVSLRKQGIEARP